MKTLVPFFLAAFILFAVTPTFSQVQKPSFESAALTKAGDGTPCVQLAWKKGDENASYYLVERSSDGKVFKQVALVFTSEDNNFSNYHFRDKNYPSTGNSLHYRIVVVNKQKEVTYLPVKVVTLLSANATGSTSVYTNIGK